MSHHPILRRLILDLVVIGLLVLYIVCGNTSIGVSRYSVRAPGLPVEFSGFTIVHISDLHNARFGEDNETLLSLIAAQAPDIIVITGDLIDSRHTNLDRAIAFAIGTQAIAPTYFVQGNHDIGFAHRYAQLKQGLLDAGVVVLENEAVLLEHNGACIPLIGLLCQFQPDTSESLVQLSDSFSGFNLLLAHHPEYIGNYVGAGAGLVFSGHAHGGQFRLPLIGGLYAPGQGVLPTYDAGLYSLGNTQMIVSRGLGNSRFPFRLNNRPDLVVAALYPAE